VAALEKGPEATEASSVLEGVLPHLIAVVQELDDVWKERLAVRGLLGGLANYVAVWAELEAVDLPERDPDEILRLYKAKTTAAAKAARLKSASDAVSPEEVRAQKEKAPTYVGKLPVGKLSDLMIEYLKTHPMSKMGQIAEGLGFSKHRVTAAIQWERRKFKPRIDRWGTRAYYVVGHFDPATAKVIEEVDDEVRRTG